MSDRMSEVISVLVWVRSIRYIASDLHISHHLLCFILLLL